MAAMLLMLIVKTYQDTHKLSRHTVVCRVVKKAGAPHREYIDRKKENSFFTHA